MVAYLDDWDNRLWMRLLIVFRALILKREGSGELDIQLPFMRQNSLSSFSLSPVYFITATLPACLYYCMTMMIICLCVFELKREGYTFIPSKKATISDRVNIVAHERDRKGRSNSHSGNFSESDRQPCHSFRISPPSLSLVLCFPYLSHSSSLAFAHLLLALLFILYLLL